MATRRSELDPESYGAGLASAAQVAAWESYFKSYDFCVARLSQKRDRRKNETTPTPRSQSPRSEGQSQQALTAVIWGTRNASGLVA